MEIDKQTVGDVVLMTFAGEFDAAGHAEQLEELDELIEAASCVIFNFRDLTFINSSALGYLLKTSKVLRERGGELVISEPAECFQKILNVYDVDPVFRVFPDNGAALDHFP